MSFTKQQQTSIRRAISEARFSTYSTYCKSDVNKALDLYQWNLEISSAFSVPLNFFEITLRNATVEAIEKSHGADWITNGFRFTLPIAKLDKDRKPKGYDHRHDLIHLVKKGQDVNHIITKLQFIFWEKMFTSGQKKIWNLHLNSTFPNLPSEYTYENIYRAINQVRNFRNRVAHYEPIFERDLEKDYKVIHEFLSWRDLDLANWIHSIQNVQSILANKP